MSRRNTLQQMCCGQHWADTETLEAVPSVAEYYCSTLLNSDPLPIPSYLTSPAASKTQLLSNYTSLIIYPRETDVCLYVYLFSVRVSTHRHVYRIKPSESVYFPFFAT